MRNKFHKLLSMFLVMLIVINQFGNITVLAESLAEQPERSLTIEVDQEEAALGEQFQLRVRGTPDLLNALVIDKSEDLIEGEVKQLNDYERLITYSSQHSGKYELTARSGDIQSNTVSIEISVPEESTSESFNVPEESTSESFNIPEESLSESFNEARSSEPSITQESQIERQEELLNYDIGISAERPTLPSRHTQTLKGYIQGGAGDILEEYGEMVVRVPRASIGLIEFIRVEVADDSPLKPLAFYQEGTDVVFPFTFDYEGLNEAAQSYTFSITFEVAFFQSGGTEPNNDFQVSLTYAERAANTEFSITPIPSSRPIFSKLYYGSREIDSQGNLGNLLIDGQDVTNSNKFILQVNYEGSRKDGVVVTDVLPQGTTLAPNPTTWSSTGNREPISGGVRIAEVTNPGEANVRTHYVSEEFVDKVSFNKETNTLVVDFGNLAEGQSYFIEYALEVTDVDLFNEGRQEDGFSRNRASMTYNNQVMSRDYRLRIPESNLPAISLRKSVDKNVINLNENELTYTLHVSMFSGTSNTLVIEDVLEEGMEFVSFLSDIPSFIDAEVNNGIVRFSANNTIGGPTSFTLSFKVNVEAYAVGDQILNFATLVNSDNRLNTSTVRTRKIDGRIKVIKTDENGQRLAGAKFEILSSDSQVIQEGITAENGEFLSEPLPVGSYQVRETEAPEGYLLDATPIEFEIERSQTAVVELTKENRLTPGGVVLTKIDDQSGEILQGAVFELQNREGETLQTGLTTGEDGKLAIDGLAPGAYQLVETQAPTGYELDATPVTFKIEKEQEVAIFLTKENRKVADSSDIRGNNPTSSGNKHLPKTGETIISQFILSILGVLLVFISIKFRKKRNI